MDRDSDLDDLAGRFIRLWEESWQQLAQDPEVARHWANLFGALGQSGAAPMATAPPEHPDEQDSADQDGPAPTAAASLDGGERVDQLADRVRKLEDRVARLARRVDRPSGR